MSSYHFVKSLHRLVACQKGQATTELVLLLPLIIVLIYIVANLANFVQLSSEFDRVAGQAIVVHGMEPKAEVASSSIESCIKQAFENRLEVQVEAQDRLRASADSIFSLAPRLRCYRACMRYRPWPSTFSIAQFSFEAPIFLEHEVSLVVDPPRSAVLI